MGLAFITLVLLVLLLIYKSLTKNDNFFKNRGVKFTKPTLLFGNLFKMITSRENGMENFVKYYRKFDNEKIFGMFIFTEPVFILKDIDIVRKISIKDFEHFANHDGSSMTSALDGIMAKVVALLENDAWREMRSILTPIFTSAKMKLMYHHLTSCAQDLDEFFADTLRERGRIVIKSRDTLGRFIAEVIASTSLGIKGNCIKDKNSEVFQLALNMQHDFSSISSLLKVVLIPNIPFITKLFKLRIFRKSIHDFFKKYVTDEIARRESQGITSGSDVIQLLIQAKHGQLKDEFGNMKPIQKKFTNWNDDELVAAQVFAMFAAGFETSSQFMEMVSWEIAMNQDIQKKLIAEIDEVVDTLDGKPVSYEVLSKMKYLDNVVSEGLRKWAPISFNVRACSKDYTMDLGGGTTVEFKKGDRLQIPIHMIQHDPKLFENPDRFDPDRFSDDNKHKIVPGSIVVWGDGPRACLGQRLALIEAKLILFTILSKYTVEACEKTPKTIKFSYATFPAFPSLKESIFVELKSRNKLL